MNTQRPTAERSDRLPTSAGAFVYGQALARAGGAEIETLSRAADTSAVYVGLYNSPAYDLSVPALAVSRLSVHLSPARATGALEGDRVATFRAPRHSVYLTPAHATAQWRKDRPSRHLNIYFHASLFAADETEEGRLDERVAPHINAALTRVLPGIRSIADDLAAELQTPGAFTAEAADCLARLLLVRLARLQTRLARPGSPIDRIILQRVKDFVQASLSETIMVGQMAAVAGLSPNRFNQAFTVHTGQTPHQYVLSQRLERAVSLLARSPMSVAEVAATCGFASQQHLTSTMRVQFGATPARYRREKNRDADPNG